MASLSDLLATNTSGRAVPGWIAALEEKPVFNEGPGWMARDGSISEGEDDAVANALDEAFTKGQVEGRQVALAELAEQGDRHEAVRLAFQSLDQSAREALAEALRETVLALCEPVLAASAVDANALGERCSEAARRFGDAAESFVMRLHPEDMTVLDSKMLANWNVSPDDTLERGSIRLESAEGTLADGPSEWRAAIAAAIAI